MCGYYKRRIGISFQLTPTNESRSWLILAPYQACAEMKETSLELPQADFLPGLWCLGFLCNELCPFVWAKKEKKKVWNLPTRLIFSLWIAAAQSCFSYFNPMFIFAVTFFQMRILFYYYYYYYYYFQIGKKLCILSFSAVKI